MTATFRQSKPSQDRARRRSHFDRIHDIVTRAPKLVLGIAFAGMIAAGVFGAPVVLTLPSGGYTSPDSESARVQQLLNDTFGVSGLPVVIEITSAAGLDSPAVAARAAEIVDELARSPYAGRIVSYWTAPPQLSAALRSTDETTGLIAFDVLGDDGEAQVRAHDITAPLVGTSDGVSVAAGGLALAYYDVNTQSKLDFVIVEAVAVPITFLVLVWVFRSVIASIIPLAVAGFATAGSVGVLRLIAMHTDVSVFAINLASAICLALAIDYTLFLITRYREETQNGNLQALRVTLNTAGRTVVYSAATVALAIAPLLIYPMYFLRSLAYAGLIGVALALVGALLIAPALLVVFGSRLDDLDLRRVLRRWRGRPEQGTRPIERTPLYRSTTAIMRHALPIALLVGAVLLLLGSPFLDARLSYPDDRALPTSSSSRQVGDDLRERFDQNVTGTVQIAVTDTTATPAELNDYAARVSQVPDITAVSAPGGIFVGGELISIVTSNAGARDGVAYFSAATRFDPYSAEAKDQLAALKDVRLDGTVLFAGLAQQNLDNVDAILDYVPLVLTLIVVTTLLLVFLMTGSVLLPIKAVVLNFLSLTVAFGAMVWVFQEGHLGGLGLTTTGDLLAPELPLIFCVAFGLSMDYEIFVLSRMVELWQHSGKTAADNERVVALGLARTGPIVTAAALVMVVVFAALTASEVALMRMLGVGLAITVLVDAFVIRVILVPAFMKLFGRLNWWAPAPLQRIHRKFGLSDA